jgi:nucleotidyltransferase/DNA polymerase involved in DNA repair
MPAASHCRARVATPPARLRAYVGRGVVTTATYVARALGVHSGMALMAAARLAPDAWRLPADFDACRRTSRRFDNFRTVTRDHTRPEATRDPAVIRRAAGPCLERIVLDRRIRLLGVRVGTLVREAEAGSAQDRPVGSRTRSLFD